MGTPFAGTRYTYLALVTPLGFLWRDVWQMRPGSLFLKSIHDVEVPEDVDIYCLHSFKDKVWDQLYELSTETFVEETDRLKENAAGAGLADND